MTRKKKTNQQNIWYAFIVFGLVVTILVPIWLVVIPALATFIATLFGGFLITLQVLVSNRRAKAAEDTAKAAAKTAKAMQKTAELTESRNIAERFKNAIEHLGNNSASIRLGGIYVLHHIARKEEEYRERIFKILCAHIRLTTTQKEYKSRKVGSMIKPTIEIQIILDLLFCEGQEFNKIEKNEEIYKGNKANLEGSQLRGAGLYQANLNDAYLYRVNLQNAGLWDIHLQGADLRHANLQGVEKLSNAKLKKADFRDAELQNAILRGSDFKDAKLQGANLQNSDFKGAINLKIEQLLEAKTLFEAILPEGMKEEIMQKKPELFNDPDAE